MATQTTKRLCRIAVCFFMLSPVVYLLSGVLVNGKYLPGHYWWTSAVEISKIQVTGQAPTAGALTLQLEVDDVLTDYSIAIPSNGGTFQVSDDLVASVPANASVRWLAAYTGSDADAATEVTLTMTVVSLGASPPLPALTVRDANSGLTFYTYNPTTATFTDVIPSQATVTWSLVQDGETSLSIQSGGQTLLSVTGGVFSADAFSDASAFGGTPLAGFYVGDHLSATLGSDGTFYAVSVTQGMVPALSELSLAYWNQFEFWSADALTAVLSAAGLTASNLQIQL